MIRRTAAQNRFQLDAVNVRSRNRDSFRIAIFVTKLPRPSGRSLKFLAQASEFVLGNCRQLRSLLLTISQVFDVNSLSDRRLRHQIFHLIFVLNLLPVETQNHVAANQAGLVRGSVRHADAFEDHAFVRCC